MEKIVLKATKRTVTGKQVKQLRRAGRLPGVIYGHHIEPINISLDAHEASLVLPKVSSSTLITLDVDGKEYATLVREKQRNFIKNRLIHIDFLAVSLTEKITATVGVEFVGVSGAVKDHKAVLVTNLDALEVECLPGDLPEKFEVDLSALKVIGDHILVKDVVVSDKVKILNDPEAAIIVATAPKVGEVVETEGVEMAAEPELSVERGKKEEEE
ncbi:MAG: 50S ribosomal protein L25 [Anaerolineales bacterium]